MAEESGFFNSYQGDRRYFVSQLAAYFAMFIGNGVFFGGKYLKVEPYGGNMDVKVLEGEGWIDGYYYKNIDAPKVLTLAKAHLTMARIDLVVLRLDLTEPIRRINAVVKTGTPSNMPVAPKLQRDNAIWELKLAEIRINANVTEILVSNILDTRLGGECGVVTSKIPSDFSLEQIFNQYSAILSEKTTEWDAKKVQQGADWQGQMTSQQSGFNTQKNTIQGWYDSVKNDIAKLQTFDFDNLASLSGVTKSTSFNEDGGIGESIRITNTIRRIASRTTSFPTDQRISVQTTVYESNGTTILTRRTATTTFNADGTIKEGVV